MADIRVQAATFDVAAEMAALTAGRTDIGGVGCFVGIVRGERAGLDHGTPALLALTLQHYPGMTEQALQRIAVTAEGRFALLGCTIVHRVGRLIPGESIVLVLTAAAHRAAALAATSFLIDWLKTRAPFWKQESFTDGQDRWVEAAETDEIAASRWDEPGQARP